MSVPFHRFARSALALFSPSARPIRLERRASSCVAASLALCTIACTGAPDAGPASVETGQDELALRPPPTPLVLELARTALVVEGVVGSTEETYDDWAGPRTVAHLEELTVHLGAYAAGTLDLPLAGGALPDGRRMRVADMPRLRAGERYVLFLGNEPWFYSPVRLEALRVEEVSGHTVMVDDEGYPFLRLDEQGMVFGETRLFEPDPERPDGEPRLVADVPAAALEGASSPADLVHVLQVIAEATGLEPRGTFSELPNPDHSRWNVIPTIEAPPVEADPHAADPHAADPHAADPHAADAHETEPSDACEGTVPDEC